MSHLRSVSASSPMQTTSSLLTHNLRPELTSRSGGPHTTNTRDSSSRTTYSPEAPTAFQSTSGPTMDELVSPPSPTESTNSPRSRSDRQSRQSRRTRSLSCSSQGDTADTDVESGPSSQPEQPSGHQHFEQPVKKKRTRTLTTPHQSAVLHALLAQSRFPTTAMREEVGRQIGLSARKVQIWFQNQRQKARRPHGQNNVPQRLQRPPQFGPFPSVSIQTNPAEHPPAVWINSQYPSSTSTSAPFDSPPGPSASSSIFGGSTVVHDSQYTLHALPHFEGLHRNTDRMPQPSSGRKGPLYLGPETSLRSDSRYPFPPAIERHEKVTLPPLAIDHDHQATTARTSPASTILNRQAGQPPSNFHIADIRPGTQPPMMSALPPPFTLEPLPQWQPEPVLAIGPAWRGRNLLIDSRGSAPTIQDRPSDVSRAGRMEQSRGQQALTTPSSHPVLQSSSGSHPLARLPYIGGSGRRHLLLK